jgi:aspartate kinase
MREVIMRVFKFGGTSVGDARAVATVADIIGRHRPAAPEPAGGADGLVVVVSAMAGVTNRLIAAARAAAAGRVAECRDIKATLLRQHLAVVDALLGGSAEGLEAGGLVEDSLHELERLLRSIALLGELTRRGLDVVSAFGERMSVGLVAAVLRRRGVRAQALSAAGLIVTDGNFGAAAPDADATRQRLRGAVPPLLARGVVPVVTGFIAATADGVTTTLGRGGSDFTAAIVGAALDADEVWIWTDVDGILTADPNLVPEARTLAELSYAEAAELAYFGADVLHPKTIGPLVAGGIPLRILNTFNPDGPGTRIVPRPAADREALPALISTEGLAMIAVGTADDSWTLQRAAEALQRLGEAGVDVPMFSQSFSEHRLNLVVRGPDQAHALGVLQRAFGAAGGSCTIGGRGEVATLSVVGSPGTDGTALVARAFGALGRRGTPVLAVAQGTAGHSVSLCVPEAELAGSVRDLHRELGVEVAHA